jgi:hypothetical protein
MRPGGAKALRWVERNMQLPLTAVCAYEAVALGVPVLHLPPISTLAHRHRHWAIPLCCGAFIAHVWFYEETHDRRQVP